MRTFPALVLAVATCGCMTTACDTDNTYDVETSAECLVTSATLGTLPRTMHTLSSAGEDSTYTVNVSGSYYPLYIDQVQNRIYNGDSLPVGTDVTRVTFQTFSTIGTAAIRSLVSGTDTTFSATDSTDFSRERLVTIYSSDGTARREYRVNINVHREEADSFRWARPVATNEFLPWLTYMRAAVKDGYLYIFAREREQKVLLKAPTADPSAMTRTPLSGRDAPDPSTIVAMGGSFYGLLNGKPARTEDGIMWMPLNTTFRPDALVAAGSRTLYALSDGQLYASADGISWTEEKLDEPDRFPTEQFAWAVIPSRTDTTFEDILLVGRRNGEVVVWKRNIDLTGGEQFAWNYYPTMADNPYNCPQLTDASLIAYDEGAVLCGRDADGNVAPLYMSHDGGRTWKDDDIPRPEAAPPVTMAVTTDDDNYIWMICAGTGEVWRGRLNRLGWADQDFSFTRGAGARR